MCKVSLNLVLSQLVVIAWLGLVPDLRAQATKTPGNAAPTAQASDPTTDEHANYRISPDDLIDVRVFQEPDLDAVIRVSSDGTANFSLIGNVALGGKTIPEAVALLEAKYHDGYLVNPQVNLTLRAYAKKRYTVLGQVQKPGSYTIEGSEEITLLQAIGIAGGFARDADEGRVTIKRREKGKETVIRIDANKMAKGKTDSSFILQPGDVVTVGESIF